jgi:hypothetical protein
VLEYLIYRIILWPALMVVEIGLELLFGFVGVGYKLCPRPEGQLADIAIRDTRGAADESHDLEIPIRHCNIIIGVITESNENISANLALGTPPTESQMRLAAQ